MFLRGNEALMKSKGTGEESRSLLSAKIKRFMKKGSSRRILIGLVICIGLVLLFNAVNDDVNPEDISDGRNKRGAGIKVGIVLSEGGKGDKSFNDSAIAGLEKAKKELGITYKDIEILDNSQNRISIEFLAKDGCNLVIGVGGLVKDIIKETALKYPDTKFVLIDEAYSKEETPDNVCGMKFRDNEGSYLAGVLAAGMSNTKKVGFIGGMELPVIHRFEGGYKAGAKTIPGVEVYTSYVSTDGSGFNNPDKGRELTFDFVSKGVDVVYTVAGNTGKGVFNAAAISGIKAIGVDANQNWVSPGVVVASMLKSLDLAVYDACESIVDKRFPGGETKIYGLSNDGVNLTDLYKLEDEEIEGISKEDQQAIKDMKDAIPEEVKNSVEQARKDIISGKVIVPDWSVEGKQE